jgi:hypothetical protein
VMGRYPKDIDPVLKAQLIAKTKKEKNLRYKLSHRNKIIKYMRQYHVQRSGQQALGTTNFSKNSSVEAEIKKLGLSNYFKACRAKNKEDLDYARSCIRAFTSKPEVAETGNNGVWEDADAIDPSFDENGDDVEEE